MKPVITAPVAATAYGTVRGVVENNLAVFRGVPYAAAPVGGLRYHLPVAPASWSGERDATQFGVIAPQLAAQAGGLFDLGLRAGEDCLTLNIWTPTPDPAGLPVIVWIHGGGFLFGAGANPIVSTGSFARDGVVFVSINYRLGTDGFLFVKDDPASGNYGLLDQIAALRWVQENIAAFGGDPARVTVGGQSAGATAVAALLAAPAARGLFSRAIVQSGYPDPLLSERSAQLVAHEIYLRAGLSYGDLDGLRGLRERTPQRVLQIQMELFAEVLSTRDSDRFETDIAVSGNPFQPVVGGGVLPTRPVHALAAEPSPVELLIGCNTEEFGLMYGTGMLSPDVDGLADAYERALPGRGSEALRLYRLARPSASPLELLTALESDRLYRAPTTLLADIHAGSGAATYFYRFAWQSAAFGAGHSVEQPFVFDALDLPQAQRFTGPNPPQQLADDMHRAWVAFARSGDPNHQAIPAWPRYTPATRAMLAFGSVNGVVHNPDADQLRLWSPLLLTERRP
jgi:para-nitrobenzyl esterase